MKRSLLLTLALAVLLWFAGSATAATFTVNTTADTPDASPRNGVCADSSGNCSLRAAIMEANALGGSHTIVLQSGQTYTLSRDTAPGDDNTAAQDDLDIAATITIQGNGATVQRSSALTCNMDGANQADEFRIFHVLSGGNLTLDNITVRNGCADPSSGGGIFVDTNGQLTITNSTISGNSAKFEGGGSGGGGGIENNGGTVTITNSTISGNLSFAFAGGINNFGGTGTVTITNSTISGNSAQNDGGGIWNGGTLTITNSTISGNSTQDNGGGIWNGETLTITNSTISGNSAQHDGGGIFSNDTVNASFVTIANNTGSTTGAGGIYLAGGTFNIKNSIVANNTGGPNCAGSGTLSASGVNFATDSSCTGFTQVTSAQLNLQPLANNGGPTQTHALGSGSVAIDAVTDCTNLSGNQVTTDQRGVSRPQGTRCDAGAFEAQYSLTVNKTGTGSGTVTSNPAGINCGNDCTETYSSGTTITLTATPNPGSVFAGWSGDCSSCGTNPTCTITMNANKTCTATFNTAGGGGGGGIPAPSLSNITSPEFGDLRSIDFRQVPVLTKKGPAIVRIESQTPIFISGIQIREISTFGISSLINKFLNLINMQTQEQNFTLDLNAGDRPCGTTQFNLAGYCTVGIIFEPKSVGKKEAHLEVYYNTPYTARMYITGEGVQQSQTQPPPPQPPTQPPSGGSTGGSGASSSSSGGGGGCSLSYGVNPLNAIGWLLVPVLVLVRRIRSV